MKKLFLLLMVIALLVAIIAIPTVAFAADDTGGFITASLPAWAWVLIAVGVIVFVILLMFLILPKVLALAQKKGYDVFKFLKNAGDTIHKTDQVVETLIKLGAPINIVDTILDYAAAGVKYAEQLCYASVIKPEERNEKAKQAIMLLLKKAGMPLDQLTSEELQQLIDIGLEAAVGDLGHISEINSEQIEG